jgi:hypothetical protein
MRTSTERTRTDTHELPRSDPHRGGSCRDPGGVHVRDLSVPIGRRVGSVAEREPVALSGLADNFPVGSDFDDRRAQPNSGR